MTVANWADGEYRAAATLSAEGQTLLGEARISKPPTPWLPKTADWRADRVLDPWTALSRQATTVKYWNGEISLPGALPTRLTVAGEEVLAAPIRLVAEASSTWQAPRVTEGVPQRVSLAGVGALGALQASYETLVEFDGLVRTDLTLTPPAGGADLASLSLEIPLRPEVARLLPQPLAARNSTASRSTRRSFSPTPGWATSDGASPGSWNRRPTGGRARTSRR